MAIDIVWPEIGEEQLLDFALFWKGRGMKGHKKTMNVIGPIFGLIFISTTARGEVIPYQHVGVYNSAHYSFSAKSNGNLTGYFLGGSTAAYHNAIGVLVNGTQLGNFSLGNHDTSVGISHVFGHVNAGDNIIFVMRSYTLNSDAYSDPKMNVAYDNISDLSNHNHIYSATYGGSIDGSTEVPKGVYVGFEDLRSPHSDYNYNDESVVFTNVNYQMLPDISSSVPEPSSWAMILLGFAGLAFAAGRKQTQIV